ncbi:MAG: restriction endonuclease [Aquabacterium sp.]|nr:restriction endonuclease [Aquabacterium sp.]
MKFNLPRNSLFSMLLRSPWWVSVAIAAVLGLVAAALLPEAFRVVGSVSGFPFLVIAAMAAQRQWRLPSAARVQQTQAAVSVLAWPAFQALLTKSFQRNGFEVLPSPRGDAVDLVLQRQGRRKLVSARRWKTARLGVEPLRALQAARQADDTSADLPQAVCICLAGATDNALDYARTHAIALWGASELAVVLRGMPLPPTPPALPAR